MMNKVTRQLDPIDIQIISILIRERSISNVEIASRIGSSEATVRRRVQALVDEGILEFIAIVNPEKMGLRAQVIVGIDADLTQAQRAADALKALPEIQYLAYVTGRYDLVITANLSAEAELFEFLTNRLASIPGILNMETLRILKVVKRHWRFLPGSLTGASLPTFAAKKTE
jgi:Lrp/AsnC family transcriptional regulator for asnA, asnC and gidA